MTRAHHPPFPSESNLSISQLAALETASLLPGCLQKQNGWPRRRRVRAGSRVSWINTSSGGGDGAGLDLSPDHVGTACVALLRGGAWHTATPWAAEGWPGVVHRPPVHVVGLPGARPVPLLPRLCLAWWRFLPQDSVFFGASDRARPALNSGAWVLLLCRKFEITAQSGLGRWPHTLGAARKRWLLPSPPRPPPPSPKARPGGHLGGASRGPWLPGRSGPDGPSGCPSPSGLRQPAGWLGPGSHGADRSFPSCPGLRCESSEPRPAEHVLGRIDSSVLSRNKTEVSLSEELGATGAGGGSGPRPGLGSPRRPGHGCLQPSPEAPGQAPSAAGSGGRGGSVSAVPMCGGADQVGPKCSQVCGLVRDSSSSEWLQQKEGFVGECNGAQARLGPGAQSLAPLSLCPYLMCPLVWPYSQPDFPEWRRSWPPAASGQAAEPSNSSSETAYLRLGQSPRLGPEPSQNPQHLDSGLMKLRS